MSRQASIVVRRAARNTIVQCEVGATPAISSVGDDVVKYLAKRSVVSPRLSKVTKLNKVRYDKSLQCGECSTAVNFTN